MNRRELLQQADQILRRIERIDACPHYVEDSFRRKMMLALNRERKLRPAQEDKSHVYLLEMEWERVFCQARLTQRQIDVVRARLAGQTFEEAGQRQGCSKQAILNILKQAVKKIEAVSSVYPYTGLAEVYREEVRRGIGAHRKGRL